MHLHVVDYQHDRIQDYDREIFLPSEFPGLEEIFVYSSRTVTIQNQKYAAKKVTKTLLYKTI